MERWLLLGVLLLPACASTKGSVMRPGPVYLGAYSEVLDAVWSAVGKLEVVVCFDAEPVKTGGWEITRVALPVQLGDSASATFDCDGYPGWGHNHPTMGGVYLDNPKICDLSPVDLLAIRTLKARFHVLWCAPGVLIGTAYRNPPSNGGRRPRRRARATALGPAIS